MKHSFPNTKRNKEIDKFSEQLLTNYHGEISGESIDEFMEIFHRLHSCTNAPHTRPEGAKIKSKLVEEVAKSELKKRKQIDYSIEQIQANHTPTNTDTFNTVVTIGNPKTGPCTIVAVHHDVITAEDYSLEFDCKTNTLKGRTIQDNTIHLAAILANLRNIDSPKTGAIIFLFTDHEENGCRGSSAIQEIVTKKLNTHFPISLVAMESTDKKLAIGHRGKYSSELRGNAYSNLAQRFLSFYRQIRTVQYNVCNPKDKSKILGHTTGLSTYGYVDSSEFFAKLDFRTNDIISPEKVHVYWEDALESNKLLEHDCLIKEAKKLIANELYQISITADSIVIKSKTKLLHPSTYVPSEDQTVMPLLYLLIQIAVQKGDEKIIDKITWGEKVKQNSNPVVAMIEGDFLARGWSIENILTNITNLEKACDLDKYENSDELYLDKEKTLKTGAVASEQNNFIDKIIEKYSTLTQNRVDQTVMDFMTDIGGIFNLAKTMHFPHVFGFIYGVGNSKNLHQIESITTEDAYIVYKYLGNLINIIQSEMHSISSTVEHSIDDIIDEATIQIPQLTLSK